MIVLEKDGSDFRVWQAANVVDAVIEHYEHLNDDIRSRLPLKRVWMLADAGS